jgi:ArsR family transcriptional regulator
MPSSLASCLSAAGGIAGLVREAPGENRLKRAAKRHRSLADRTRLKLLWALSVMDLCPTILKAIADVPDSKLSYHLKVLESEGLIRARRRGSWRIYSITNEGRESLIQNGVRNP